MGAHTLVGADTNKRKEKQMDNKWIQIKVTVKTQELDSLVAIMSMISNGLQIED